MIWTLKLCLTGQLMCVIGLFAVWFGTDHDWPMWLFYAGCIAFVASGFLHLWIYL